MEIYIYIIVWIIVVGFIIATKFDKLKDKITDLETRIEDLENEQSTNSDDVDFPNV